MTPHKVRTGLLSRFIPPLTAMLIGLATLVGAMEAAATTVLWAPVDVLAERSSLIVQGTVDSKTVITSDHGFGVYTEYRIRIDNVMKGEERAEAIIRIPGGETVDRQLDFHGAPVLEIDAEYVLLLEAVPPEAYGHENGDYFIPIGLGQGVWQVVRREVGVEVIQQTGDVTLVSKTGTPPTTAMTMSLSDLGEVVSGGQP